MSLPEHVPDEPDEPRRPARVPALDDPEALEMERTWRRPRGLLGWLIATNHKDLGMRFIVTAMGFFAMAGVLAAMMRFQLSRPQNGFLGPDAYNQIFTVHGTAMMFLFAVPVMQGMGLYLVPLMVGTRNVSFPRLLNFGYWTYVAAGLMLFTGLVLSMGPDAGWFAYTPLSGPAFSPGKRLDLWCQFVTVVEMSSIVAAIEIITTVFKHRAPGMSLDRIPLFVWAQLIAAAMVMFAMPSVQLATTLLSMDRLSHVNTHFFNPAEGGDTLLWQHLFWFFAHPEVYIIFIPATGFVSAILPTFARRSMFGYPALVLSMTATAFIGFGVWVHHMFATPLPELGQGMFTASSLLITIPNGVQFFCWIATLWGGRLQLRVPMLYVLGFLVLFLIGGLSGVLVASQTIDTQVHDTYFVVAHLHYVLIGGALFPLLGAFTYWFPKWTGRMMSERFGVWSFALIFLGFNLTFFPMHFLGLRGMPRRVYTYTAESGWSDLNLLASIGAGLLAIGLVSFLVNMARSRTRGAIAGDDPWGAGTLEWATTSPPPACNFRYLPTVQGRDPLWENAPDAPVVTGLSTRHREVLVTTAEDAIPDTRLHLAGESVWAFLSALILAGTFIWLIYDPHAVWWGGLGLGVTLTLWFLPRHHSPPIRNPRRASGARR